MGERVIFLNGETWGLFGVYYGKKIEQATTRYNTTNGSTLRNTKDYNKIQKAGICFQVPSLAPYRVFITDLSYGHSIFL
jgi:hypothetical protein